MTEAAAVGDKTTTVDRVKDPDQVFKTQSDSRVQNLVGSEFGLSLKEIYLKLNISCSIY